MAETGMLSVRGLSRRFGGVQAVNDVSFEVARGGITGLIGPNGAGKSTVVALVTGALRPDEGEVYFDDQRLDHLPTHRRARLGLVRTFQHSSEFPNLSVLENLLVAANGNRGESLWGALRGKRHWRAYEEEQVVRAQELLRRFAMTDKELALAGRLSGGQKRLVEIMRALMAQPRVLLLDEPMAGVHPDLGRRIAEYLEQFRDEGMTMLMIEHELSIVDRLCDPVVVMAQGKVIAQGSMDALRQRRDVVDAYLVG